ncbi:SMP-30/gluconolactonase/LRE family protein [Aurantibacter crassamenti]|uniref:SMP-30/gluconolactonase/LRE family protein n=1 Tax=Aurantibacter crassamenti TaxID=1837375 RepID=UPI001939E6C8|nr:SMP-30/gluconolactonase/LRE family protein [Aurantibacter crassamenti]MBM1105199.1 SMP-30/gluconolactonase/LRE family protein [Aurantibacter crassamenti]
MAEILGQKAKLLLDTKSVLGEGPVWDFQKLLLYWVDIEGYKLHQYNPSTEKINHWVFKEMIGAAVPKKNGQLLLAMEKGLASFDPGSKELTKHGVLENSNPNIRFNDGKVGPKGNFWVGTMDKNCAPNAGNFYHISQNFEVTKKIPNTSVSNGLAWSSDNKTLYYIDSPSFKFQTFDFNIENNTITNEKTVINVPEEFGSPDGMSIDEEGMLWVAHWGGNCIRRWNPKTGEILLKIDVDAPHVTSCCFGGPDLKTLYITTARSGLSESQLKKFPLSGGLFTYQTKVKGTPINYF